MDFVSCATSSLEIAYGSYLYAVSALSGFMRVLHVL